MGQSSYNEKGERLCGVCGAVRYPRKVTMKYMKLHERGQAPTQGRDGDAGYDLYASHSHNCYKGVVTKVRTGIAVEIPEGMVGVIMDRSGMGAKGFKVMGGVIDSNYRGEVMVCLFNASQGTHRVEIGDRVAQMVVVPCSSEGFVEVTELTDSERGEKGFGSSGN